MKYEHNLKNGKILKGTWCFIRSREKCEEYVNFSNNDTGTYKTPCQLHKDRDRDERSN